MLRWFGRENFETDDYAVTFTTRCSSIRAYIFFGASFAKCQENAKEMDNLRVCLWNQVTKKNAWYSLSANFYLVQNVYFWFGCVSLQTSCVYNFFFLSTLHFAFSCCLERLNFLRSAIAAHGDCPWHHIITSSAALRFGIVNDIDSERSGAAKLAMEMRLVNLFAWYPNLQ